MFDACAPGAATVGRSVAAVTALTGEGLVFVTISGRRDLSGQVYRQVRAAIVDGRLPADAALPSMRDLAAQLAVSRGTVATAYGRLSAEGFVRSRAGAGSVVNAAMPPPVERGGAGSPLRHRAVWDQVSEPPDMSIVQPDFDFRSGIPDTAAFPYSTWRALLADHMRLGAVGTGTHIGPAGHQGLRVAIARHIGVSRAVRAAPEDVVVTNGSQQAVDLIGRVLLEPGDVVAVEDPGHLSVRRAFTALGARVVGVPVDEEGLVVDGLPARARLVYVTPSHQYPLGMTMSLPRRLALLAWAEQNDAAIIEDDYDGEFRYGGRPLETLCHLDSTGRVLYVGSFSKVLLPTLRLGFVVAPTSLHGALRKAKHVADWHTAVPIQAAAAAFIDNGLLARHIRRMRGIYLTRHHVVRACLGGELAEHLVALPSAAGMHIAAELRDPDVDDVALARRAAEVGVAVQPLSMFAVTEQRRRGVVIGYGAIATGRIEEGLRTLHACLG